MPSCLLVKTAFFHEIGEVKIRNAVKAGAKSVRTCFARVISAVVARGDVEIADPVAHAAYLYAVLNGLSALATTGGTSRDVVAALDATF